MSRHVLGSVVVVTLLAAGHAQQAEGRHQAPAPAERPPAAQNKPAPSPSEATPPAPQGQPVNIKLDLTITDQTGTGQPAKKTVSVIVADRGNAMIRSSGNNVHATINVDASPQILLGNGNIRLILGVEYNPRQGPAEKVKGPGGEMLDAPDDARGSTLNQRVMVLLEPNKPLIISQAADPLSDRKVSLEIRATILK